MLDGKPWKQINLNVPSRIELPPNPNVVMDISAHIKFEPWLWQGLWSGQNRLAMVLGPGLRTGAVSSRQIFL
jgi:hypothetical protein